MKRAMLVAAVALVLGTSAVVAAPGDGGSGDAGSAQSERPVRGTFSTVLMVHTTGTSFGDLSGVRAWDGIYREREVFSYRSIGCSGNAPVNNIGTDLTTYNARVLGSRVPASIRAHPFAFRFVRDEGRWVMQGQIELVACKMGPGPTPQSDPVPDRQKDRIYVRFFVRTITVNRETARFHGRFVIRGGTGRYEDLRGRGDIAGYFLCFAQGGCAQAGRYADAQMTFSGDYEDPTPQLSAG